MIATVSAGESGNVWGIHKHQSVRNWGATREVCPLPQRSGKELYAPSTGSTKAFCSDSSVCGAWLPGLVGTWSRREAVTWQMNPGEEHTCPCVELGEVGAAEGSREPPAPLCQGGPCPAPPLCPALFPPHPSLEHRVPGQGLQEAQPRYRMRGGRCGRERGRREDKDRK